MNIKHIILTTLGAAALMTSCTDIEEHSQWGYDVSPQLSAYIKGGEAAMASTQFPEGAEAGVYLTTVNGDVDESTAMNRCYKLAANGTMTPADEKEAVLFPADGSKRDIVAYYPYDAKVRGAEVAVNVENQKEAALLDLLYSNSAKGEMGLDKKIRLGFKHAMTQLLVITQKAEGAESAYLTTATIENAALEGKLNLNTGKVKAGSKKGTVAMTMDNDDLTEAAATHGVRFDAVVVPTGKTTLQLTMGMGEAQTTVEVKDVDLAAGKIVVVPVAVAMADGKIKLEALDTYAAEWTSLPGVKVATPQRPSIVDPGEGGEGGNEGGETVDGKTVFYETFGSTPVAKGDKGWPYLSQFTGWSNPNLKFEDLGRSLSVRFNTEKNCVWFKASKDNQLKISGFDTKGAKKLTLSFAIMADLANSGAATNLDLFGGSFNGKAFKVASKAVKNPEDMNKWTEVSIDLPVDVAKENSELIFALNNAPVGFRLADIKLVASNGDGGEGGEVKPQPAATYYAQDFSTSVKVEKEGGYWPDFMKYVDKLNTPGKFATSGKFVSIRYANNANNIWFAKKYENWIEFQDIDVKKAKEVTITAGIAANLFNAGETNNLNGLEVEVGGQTYTFASTPVENKDQAVRNLSVKVPVASSNFTFRIKSNPSVNLTGLRLYSVKVESGASEGGGETPEPGGGGETPEPGGGGETPEPGGGGETPVPAGTIFVETFGEKVEKEGSYWPSVDKYTGWDNKDLKFSDPYFEKYVKASVRMTSTMSPHVWLAGKTKYDSHTALKVEGFKTEGYKKVVMKVDLASNSTKISTKDVIFKANGKVIALPEEQLKKNEFTTYTVELPANTTSIEFEANNLADGLRIDNLKLLGE